MISMGVSRITPISVPLRDPAPGLAAVPAAMQVHTAADYVIRIRRVHDNGITVRDLSFILEMAPLDVFPRIAAIHAAKNSQQEIFVAGGFILRERVHHLRLRRTKCQTGTAEKRGIGKFVREVLPFLAPVTRTPDAAPHPLFGKRREDCALPLGMKDNGVTTLIVS